MQGIRNISSYLLISFKMALKVNLAYPVSFWFTFIIIPFYSIIQIVFIETIYGQTNSFVGYTKYDAYILFGTYRLVQGIGFFIVHLRLADLKYMIRGDGEESFDNVLIKPIDSQLFATLGRFNTGNISSIIVGSCIALYGVVKGGITIQPISFLLYLCLVFMGVLVMYITFLLLNTLHFWFDKFDVTEGLWDAYQAFGQYPTGLYQGITGILFNIILPITLMAAIPVEILLGKMSVVLFVLYVIIVSLLFMLSRLFWQTAIKRYSSFSS